MAQRSGSTVPAQRPSDVRMPRTPSIAGRPLAQWYTWVVAALVVAATLYGLLANEPYRVTEYLALIWRAQDIVTLCAVPVLVWSASKARDGSLRGHLVWVGIMFWLAYAYAHYAFGAPYNRAFLVYVAIVGLAAYALLDGLLRINAVTVTPAFAGAPRRATAWFLALGGVGIAGVWLGEIVAAYPDGQPASNLVYDMPSPTYVLDLAWLIPVSLAAAWLLRRGHPAGPLLAAVTLVVLLVLSLAMLAVTLLGVATGLATDPRYVQLFIVFGSVFGLLLVVGATLLVSGARRMQPIAGAWLRLGLWQ